MSGTRHSDGRGPFEAVVVVGSLGALDSFAALAASLPEGFPAAVVFDLHRSAESELTEPLLRRRCPLPVRAAEDGEALEAGQVYLAPSDRQLVIVEDRRMRILSDRPGFGHRFADALLTSAAIELGSRLIAVVLSGRLHGGAQGVRDVKRHGGRVLAQDPESAVAPDMPRAALATGQVDFVLAPDVLGHALLTLCAAVGAADLFRVRLNAGVSG